MSGKNKSSSGFIKTVLVVLISLGLGSAGAWYYINHMMVKTSQAGSVATQDQQASAPQLVAAPAPDPIFYEMTPLTLTFRHDGISRILYVGLTIQFADQQSKARFERYLPVARSRIITEMSEINPAVLGEKPTKQTIREVVANALTAPFSPEVQRQNIADVLFTAYVVQ